MKTEGYGIPYSVDLTQGDYTPTGKYKDRAFGVYLKEGGILKVLNEDGIEDILDLGIGYHPIMITKIFETGTNVTSLIVLY